MHTEGKLEVVTDCPGECCWHIQKVGNTDKFNRLTSLEMGEEDARRLVACWNACEKFSTEDIERANEGYPQGRDRIELILDLTEARKRVAILESERDELVKALRALYKDILDEFSYYPDPLGIESILAKYPQS
jgi:hypothetical protein